VIRALIGVVVLVALFFVGWLAATEVQGFLPASATASSTVADESTGTTANANANSASTSSDDSTDEGTTTPAVQPPAPENPYATAYTAGSQVIIDGNTIDVALSTTTEAIDQGLQSQPSLPANDGMLFIFDTAKIYQFWMPNMNFSLDMIWIGSNDTVVSITRDAPPLPDPANPVWFRPTAPAQYVLEVNADYAAAHNISVGDPVQFVSVPQ
jgi:hypothetical protein